MRGRVRKTLEAQEPLFRRGVPTLQTSLTSRELPPRPRHLGSEDLFRFRSVAGSWGKFLSFGEVRNRLKLRLSRGGSGRRFLGCYSSCRCQDPACGRLLGEDTVGCLLCGLYIWQMNALPLRGCRDPACGRPSGVRLRGIVCSLCSPFHSNAAPLRMTKRAVCYVGYIIIVS